jgi:cystinosin
MIGQILFGSEARSTVTIFSFVVIVGLVLGLTVDGSSSLPTPWRFWSNLIGWMYFSAWSVSFWPQVIMIMMRGRVSGLSFDFLALNLLGFSCYSAYNIALYSDATVRAQYAIAHSGKLPAVQLNDVLFGLHAIFATVVSIIQCMIYPRDPTQRVTLGGAAWLALLILAVVVYAIVVASSPGGANADKGASIGGWLSYFTFVSYVKLAISLTKYVPQVYLNYSKRSTDGWSIHNVLLDFTGGLLSVVQLLGDSQYLGGFDAV